MYSGLVFDDKTMSFLMERRRYETWFSFFLLFLQKFGLFFLFFFSRHKKHQIHAIFSFVHNTKTGYWLLWLCMMVCVGLCGRKLMLKKLQLEARAHDVYLVGGHRTSCTTLITFTLCLWCWCINFFLLFILKIWRRISR